MKTTYNILKQFRESFGELLPNGRIMEIGQSLSEDDVLITEVHFAAMENGEYTDYYTAYSNIDVRFFDTLSEQEIASQIVGDIIVDLSQQMCEDAIIH
ncbi:hypothetical protein KUA24_111 [Vibrio phage HNL01]|nr:hypothetical protein KUA24_111 [Vibrio phage HNL01]